MGINDRDYGREADPAGMYGTSFRSDRAFGRRGSRLDKWSANTWLIAVNVAIFVLQVLVPTVQVSAQRGGGQRDLLTELGHFSTFEVMWAGGLEFWRFITFQFLHANLLHIGFNMLGLYIFGSMVEEYLGRKKYLAYYLTCGVFGALLFLILNAIGLHLAPNMQKSLPILLTSSPYSPLVGASAGVFGVIIACAYIRPDEIVQIPIPPVQLRMKVFAYIYVGIAVANLLLGGRNQGGDAAHLGGALAGYFLIRHSHLLRDFFDVWGDSRKVKQAARRGLKLANGERKVVQSAPQIDAEEIDRILAKHKEYGPQSLSEDELETLRDATNQMRKGDRRE
jgi:membrane associated rhomboid family serine protease